MLRVVQNDTRGKGFCGPTVVAGITGRKLSEVLDAFRAARYGADWRQHWRRAPSIRGTGTWDLKEVFRRLGWRWQQVALADFGWERPAAKPKPRLQLLEDGLNTMLNPNWRGKGWQPVMAPETRALPTLAAFLRKRAKAEMAETYVIQVSNHWIAVRGKKLLDTMTKGEPVWIGKAPHRRKRVRAVYRVSK